uniref:C2H2-type domain-containing protein n=1 Tax=Corethrella appendiculata TaxID=1370023 RepID=U5EQX0_9DIPT
MFTTNNLQTGTPTTIQYQTTDVSKQPKIEGQKTQQQPEFAAFCYSNAHASTVNLAQLTDDTKTVQYITQPFGYNYALVSNQMQIPNGVTNITVDGRQLLVNKPITNTISNISFKCDVCGLMFNHLTLLNHHKRTHNQDSDGTEAITVVTQPTSTNLVQAQNLISESGQNLGQIQIVATESLEPAQQQQTVVQTTQQQQQQQQHQQPNEVTITQAKTIHIDKTQKCITCGGPILVNPKRKGPKLIRCESCISNDNSSHNMPRPTQIFVAPDGDVKFEIGEINDSSIDSNTQIQHHHHHQSTTTTSSKSNAVTKKRNFAAVTKCTKCNGSGVIFVGSQKNKAQPIQQQPEKPFTCNTCGGKFSRYSSLWSHKKLHTGEKNYKCGVCGIAFAKAVYLKNHTRIHTGEKPYKCGVCGMQFAQSPHLKNHERTHSGEKPYVCEVCDKGFARHATLWNHRRIHTGEKPYKCNRCQSAFSQAAHLKNHEKVHSGLKPFKCDICSAAFADRFALKRHRGIHEKYGQTAPIQSSSSQMEQVVHKEEIIEMDDEPREVIISGL